MITLQFVSERWSLGAWLIRNGTWSDVSHVDLVLPNGDLLGARTDHNPGVQIRPKGYADFSRIVQVDYDFDPRRTALYIDWCKSQVGKPYDRGDIANFVIHRRRDWRNDASWICSELQARASEITERSFLDFSYIGCFKIAPRDLLLSPLTLERRYLR